MFLIELWNEYLSKTMPVLTAGGIPLVVIQMLGGLPPLAGLYRSVRRDSMAERVMLCLVPGIFVVSVAIVEPLFFDSFLGDGFPWTQALLKFLNQPRFFEEALVLAWAFLMAAAATWMAQRWDGQFYIRSYLLSIGSGLLVSSVVMILSIDHFLLGGVLFSVLGGQVVKWLVYGIYLLLYQLFVLLVCLLWRLLFSERGSVGDGNYKRWLRRYLARGYRAYGWSALMFAALWAFSIVYGLYREGSPYGWALVVNVVLVVIGVVCLVRSFLQPDYRRILSWGDPEETLCQLHHELVDKEPLVLALTDPLDNSEKIVLFEAGMGAFMEKPIAADVCAAQADALIRLNLRSKNEYYYQSILPIGPSAVISLAYRQVLVEGVPLGLTKKEFDLLHYMVKHPYQIFSKEQLYKQIWNYDVDIGGNENVKTHIKTLRRKLMVVREDMIETVRGVGYRYVPPDLPQ